MPKCWLKHDDWMNSNISLIHTAVLLESERPFSEECVAVGAVAAATLAKLRCGSIKWPFQPSTCFIMPTLDTWFIALLHCGNMVNQLQAPTNFTCHFTWNTKWFNQLSFSFLNKPKKMIFSILPQIHSSRAWTEASRNGLSSSGALDSISRSYAQTLHY